MSDYFSGKKLWELQKSWKQHFLDTAKTRSEWAHVAPWVHLFHASNAKKGTEATLRYQWAAWSNSVYVFTDSWGHQVTPAQKKEPSDLLDWLITDSLDALYIYDRLNGWTFVVTHEDLQRYIYTDSIPQDLDA